MFVVLAAAILAVVLIAFTPTLYLRTRVGPMDVALQHAELPLHLVVHGVVLTAWFSLLLIPPLLIAAGIRRAHMRLGLVGVAVAVGRRRPTSRHKRHTGRAWMGTHVPAQSELCCPW
jgi:hypothetical protein